MDEYSVKFDLLRIRVEGRIQRGGIPSGAFATATRLKNAKFPNLEKSLVRRRPHNRCDASAALLASRWWWGGVLMADTYDPAASPFGELEGQKLR